MIARLLLRVRTWLLSDPYRLTLLLLIILYVVLFARMAFDLHAGMRTHKADLGQIDQAIWNSSRGHFLEQTDNGFTATRLTDHVEPILVLISPVLWLWDDVQALLLLQVIFVAIGALPLYHLALRQFEKLLPERVRSQIWQIEPLHQLTRPLAFGLAVAYLLAPQLQSAVLTEFHAAPLAVPLILWAFWAVDSRHWVQFAVAALLTAAVKEEMALLAAGLGAWAVWRSVWDGEYGHGATVQIARRGLLAGATILVAGLVWFYLATFVIVPANAAEVYNTAESTYFQRYGALGDSAADIFISLFTRPQLVWQIASEPARVAYLVGLFVAFAWFSLLGIELVLLTLPLLLANLLSAYPAQYYGEFHYSAPLIAYFAGAAAFGLGRLWRWTARRTDRSSASFQHLPAAGGGTMAAMAMVQNARTAVRPLVTAGLLIWLLTWAGVNYLQHGRGPLGGRYDPTPVTAHHKLLERFLTQIPPEAAVTATAAVHPHVSHRRYVYQFPLGLEAPVPADWALLDVTTNTDVAPGDLKRVVDVMLEDDWGVVDGADGFLLLRRGAPDKQIPDAFYSFARTRVADSAQSVPLRLVSVEAADWPRWRQTRLIATWQVGEGFDPAKHGPSLAVITPAQETVASLGTATPPALVWYPPERWQPGERVRVETLPLALPRTAGVQATPVADEALAIFRRLADDSLARLPDELSVASSLGTALQSFVGALGERTVQVVLPSGEQRPAHFWLAEQNHWPGDGVDLWARWDLDGWPDNLSAFVHLRHNGETVAQQDGSPRFLGESTQSRSESAVWLNDWRQLTIPLDAQPEGEWTVVVGVYDPSTGERLPMVADDGTPIGDELVAGTVDVGYLPVPDQACALIPATCAAQSK